MKYKNAITFLTLIIAFMSAIASSVGIFSNDGTGLFNYQSIRGETIEIYGKGIYKHMSAEVAIQGIAQDIATLFFAVPFLLISLFFYRRESLHGKFLLSGALLYFFLTYLFYTAMAMFNYLFLVYVLLLSASLFALLLTLAGFDTEKVKRSIISVKYTIIAGWFLIFCSSMIALLWLSTIVPPLLSGRIYPAGLSHYTTMIVQGFDLGIFLPCGFVSGLLAIQRKVWGIVFSTVYVIFLSLLMLALTSKIIFMGNAGVNVIPVIFIMPIMCLLSAVLSLILMKNILKNEIHP